MTGQLSKTLMLDCRNHLRVHIQLQVCLKDQLCRCGKTRRWRQPILYIAYLESTTQVSLWSGLRVTCTCHCAVLAMTNGMQHVQGR